MKTLVIYYSHKGSNKFLAEKISSELNCDLEALKPRINSHLLFIMNIGFGNKKLNVKLENYDRIILCGPIWVGKFIKPLKSFVNKNIDKINNLIFVTCCGSNYEKKDEKFGHGLVFKQVKNILGEKCRSCHAFPITLLLPEEQKDDPDAFMKIHLNQSNFEGKIKERFNQFIEQIK